MKWGDAPTWAKTTITCFIACLGAISGGIAFVFSNFESVSASDQRWADHNQAIVCSRVWDRKDREKQILEQLKRTDLSSEERDSLKEELKSIRAFIEKFDDAGKC